MACYTGAGVLRVLLNCQIKLLGTESSLFEKPYIRSWWLLGFYENVSCRLDRTGQEDHYILSRERCPPFMRWLENWNVAEVVTA